MRYFLRFIDLESTFDNYGFQKKVSALHSWTWLCQITDILNSMVLHLNLMPSPQLVSLISNTLESLNKH
jgi:hypothetical protein